MVYHSFDSYDITPAGIDKRSGIRLLSGALNIAPGETAAVGNGENDYPMFDYAGLSVGINVPDAGRVDRNFKTSSEALDFLLGYAARRR